VDVEGRWGRLSRYSFVGKRRSRENLRRFCAEHATGERTLVVHSRDVQHARFFPNAVVISSKRDESTEPGGNPYGDELARIEDESFPVVLCTGLLEHVPDPQGMVQEFHRILAPGGRLILSASAVFSFHGGAHNFFHFTPSGFRLLFADWTRIEVLRGSSQPFETVAILLHRINVQCDVFPPVRLLVALLYRLLPKLDVFVRRQYTTGSREERSRTDSFMPAGLYAIVVK
jgi:SAM-dependent methyltransferase